MICLRLPRRVFKVTCHIFTSFGQTERRQDRGPQWNWPGGTARGERRPPHVRRDRGNPPQKIPAACASSHWADHVRGSANRPDESCRKWFLGGLRIPIDEYVCKEQSLAEQR